MAIVPQTDETMLEIFRCPQCGKIYQRGHTVYACVVDHPPGSCCHYGGRLLTGEDWNKINDVVKGIGETRSSN